MTSLIQPKKMFAAFFNLRIAAVEDISESGDKRIENLSAVLNTVAPAIVRSGGRLTRITEEGITAIFEKGADPALQAALDVFYEASKSVSAEQLSSLSIGIHSGHVILSEFVYGDSTVPVTVSDGLHIAWGLCQAAARYSARILVTETALKSVRAFDARYNFRKLGLIYLSRVDQEEMIYDMFDSDPTNLKYRKKRGKLVFETGVKLFLEGEYLQARNYFIELLKYDRNDYSAKVYVFMCDKALSGEPIDLKDKYLEIW